MYGEIAILFGVAIIASIAREFYSNKGMFILPHNTDKGYVLGSLIAVFTALVAVMLNFGAIFAMTPDTFTASVAFSLGLSWGIASTDIAANFMTKVKGSDS